MAFNRQVFRTRALTATVFVLVMLAGLLIDHWTFFLLFSVVHFGCWIEYQRLIGLIEKDYLQITPFHKYGVMLAGWCIMLYFTGSEFHLFGVQLHQLGWWLGLIFLFLLPVMEILFTRNIQLKNIGYSALGVFYISLSLGLLMNLYHYDIFMHGFFPGTGPYGGDTTPNFHWSQVLIIIGSLWLNDTLAYLVGSLIGKNPLSKISPKKTWEGTIGGIILTLIISGLIAWWIGLQIMDVVAVTGISAIAGTVGDLLESKLKRMAGVKDSGQIMPGHGGFLDRFDSLLLATPFVWIYVYFFHVKLF